MAAVSHAFQIVVSRVDLVRRHSFDSGFDNGAYYNFTFGTERPADLWRLIQEDILQAPQHAGHLALASMAMCSGEGGWGDYIQLSHWDPQVAVVSPAAL